MIITAWRLAKTEYSNTVGEMLSGEGASLYGGRWNSKGTHLVYLGSSLSLATLELLVHAPNASSVFKSNYSYLEVSFDSSLVTYVDLSDLPSDWAKPNISSPVSHIGDQWAGNLDSAVLRVPSAVTQIECNYLLNPYHPEAKQVQHGEITSFTLDERLVEPTS